MGLKDWFSGKKGKDVFSAGGAVKTIKGRKYKQYKVNVETAGGKGVPLSQSQWEKHGRPSE